MLSSYPLPHNSTHDSPRRDIVIFSHECFREENTPLEFMMRERRLYISFFFQRTRFFTLYPKCTFPLFPSCVPLTAPFSFTRFVVLGIRLSPLPSCPVLVHVFFPTLNIPRSPCPPLFVFHFLTAPFHVRVHAHFVTRAIQSSNCGVIKRKRYVKQNNRDNGASRVDLIKVS